MNTSTNRFDALESLTHEEGLRIEAIDVHQDLDLFLLVLNTKTILRQRLSDYSTLKKRDQGTTEQLHVYWRWHRCTLA